MISENMSAGGRVALGSQHKDSRGLIQNLLELAPDDAVHGVAIITSRARTTRSNHYHLTDSHWLYVVSGEMHYFERPAGDEQYPPCDVIKAGQMVYTPPMREHRTYFPTDTVLISLSRNARDHESHEDDLVRLEAPVL